MMRENIHSKIERLIIKIKDAYFEFCMRWMVFSFRYRCAKRIRKNVIKIHKLSGQFYEMKYSQRFNTNFKIRNPAHLQQLVHLMYIHEAKIYLDHHAVKNVHLPVSLRIVGRGKEVPDPFSKQEDDIRLLWQEITSRDTRSLILITPAEGENHTRLFLIDTFIRGGITPATVVSFLRDHDGTVQLRLLENFCVYLITRLEQNFKDYQTR